MNRYFSATESDTEDTNSISSSASTLSCGSKTRCIICARECPKAFTIENGKLIRIKEEMEHYSFIGEELIMARQLHYFSIMKNLLDIRNDICQNLLTQFQGQFSPEFWLPICSHCKELIMDFTYMAREKMMMERRMQGIKAKLKGFISNSIDVNDPDIDTIMWNEIREEAVFGFKPEAPSGKSESETDMESDKQKDKKELKPPSSNIQLNISILAGAPDVGGIQSIEIKNGDEVLSNQEIQSEPGQNLTIQLSLFGSNVTLVKAKTAIQNSSTTGPSLQNPHSSSSSQSAKEGSTIAKASSKFLSSLKKRSEAFETPEYFVPRKENLNVLDGYTWVSGRNKNAVYECDACPAKVMFDELQAHDFLHSEAGQGIKCKFCKVIVHFDQICDHRKYECLKCPEELRLSLKDLRERNQLLNFSQGGNQD